jgi:hypothetical protein
MPPLAASLWPRKARLSPINADDDLEGVASQGAKVLRRSSILESFDAS